MQLSGPSLKVWESYPKGHFGETVADAAADESLSFLIGSDGRAALTNGHTGLIFFFFFFFFPNLFSSIFSIGDITCANDAVCDSREVNHLYQNPCAHYVPTIKLRHVESHSSLFN